MKYPNINLPLLQWVNGVWQPNSYLVSQSQSSRVKQKKRKTQTKDIKSFTKLPQHKLPKVGKSLTFQSFLLFHQGRDNWKIYQEKDLN
jgi:hypothetical protein